jgi:hypothetical protein
MTPFRLFRSLLNISLLCAYPAKQTLARSENHSRPSTTRGSVMMRGFVGIIALAIAIILASTVARADTITYNVNQAIGSASATGTITTDGTIGTLTSANIVGWNLILNDGTNITDLVSSNSSVSFNTHDTSGTGNVDLTATSLNLMFNFSGSDGGSLGIQGASGQLCYTAWSNCFGPTGVGLWNIGGDGQRPVIDETGNQVIATAVPEPNSLLLLGTGFLSLAGAVRRRIKR